jgi:hypothetical protein
MRVATIVASAFLALTSNAKSASFDYELDTRKPPGPVTVTFAKDPVLCKAMAKTVATPEMLKNWRIVPPVGPPIGAKWDLFGTRVPGIEEFPKSEFGTFSKSKVDINNDGHPETVYGFHSVNRYRVGDMFFISPGPKIDRAWPAVSYNLLLESDPYVFPHSWAQCVRNPCKYEDESELQIKGSRKKGAVVSYRLRYLSVWPFVWQSSTYFLLFSAEPAIHTSAVVRVNKERKLEEICVFREKS